jgi:dolichyl-phosphooligosaccharide-protein glycotransferase
LRRQVLLVALIALAAFGIRTYPAWNSVFNDRGVSFLETDAWYHVRLVENQVRNYPWRVTVDPYAALGGQFVPIAPLFDTLTSTAVVMLHGRDATPREVERVAAFVPPVLGALTVVAVWALARRMFDGRAALIAAALLATLPGHFLDRTMLGFVDHHALEALLAVVTLYAFARALHARSIAPAAVAGLVLGAYLLSWGSGAFLVAILGTWLMVWLVLAPDARALVRAGTLGAAASGVALLLVLIFQDPRMHRYTSQLIALGGFAGLGGVLIVVARLRPGGGRGRAALTALVLLVPLATFAAAAAMGWLPAALAQVLVDVARLTPDPTRMGVLEARPLFMYAGEWRWAQPWTFFRTGFFIGLVALIPFAWRVWRERRPEDLLLATYAIAAFAATVGQNRFGYYLVTACALLGGWLATVLLDWGGVPHAGDRSPSPRTRLPFAREVAVVAVATMFAPNLPRSVLLAPRASSFPEYWRNAISWFGTGTPPPFATGDDFYYARYDASAIPSADYTVMNWWDQGYWLTQVAHRVPVANPTQERAPVAARFYAETDEGRAMDLLQSQRSRYVLSDWELPFRKLADETIMGRFQNVVDWAGGVHAQYYEIAYRRDAGAWVPVWIFHEPYYRSMAFRLSVMGGAAATPINATSVVTLVPRVDVNGVRFREVLMERVYPTYELARQALSVAPAGSALVGLDPWRPAFPLERIDSLVQVHEARTSEQRPDEAPWVRIFEVRTTRP